MSLGLNWVDLIILIVLAFYALEGYALGFFESLLDFIGFISSFALGLRFYSFFGRFLVINFSIPAGFANAIGFFIASLIFEIIIGLLLKKFAVNFFSKTTFPKLLRRTNNISGIVPAILSALVLLAFVLTLIVALPLSPFLKNSVSASRIGGVLIAHTQGLEKDMNKIFGKAASEVLTFLTIEPQSNETVNLNFRTKTFSIDPQAENKMLAMINHERTLRGLSLLSFSLELQSVGRAHCKDMLARGYFSHNTPDGFSPFDRMAQADISFTYTGENLALAPNVELANLGLMQSEGHRANILSQNFGKVGIGVIDGGIYGEMFCQEFTD